MTTTASHDEATPEAQQAETEDIARGDGLTSFIAREWERRGT